jgi:hypothetical protein
MVQVIVADPAFVKVFDAAAQRVFVVSPLRVTPVTATLPLAFTATFTEILIDCHETAAVGAATVTGDALAMLFTLSVGEL